MSFVPHLNVLWQRWHTWTLSAFMHSRLTHFVVLGGIIFALTPRPPSSREVRIDQATLEAMEAARARQLGTAVLPSDAKAALDTQAIEDEVLYREALRLGLDKSDNVVRQRLIQKVLFLAENLRGATQEAPEQEVRAFYEATRAQWVRPAWVHFFHIYAGEGHRDQLLAARTEAVSSSTIAPDRLPPLGGAFALPRDVQMSQDDVAAEYGAAFNQAVSQLEPGTWSAPIRSKFGWHLVRVLDRRAAGPATFEEVKGKVRLAYLVTRKKQAAAEFLREASGRYHITVDGQPVTMPASSSRSAPTQDNEPD